MQLPNVDFTDNIGIKKITYPHGNPVEIQRGHLQTIIISAEDRAGNVGDCRVRVEVTSKICNCDVITSVITSCEMSIVNALPKVVGFLRVLRFPPQAMLTGWDR